MVKTAENLQSWINHAETRDSRLFAVIEDEILSAFIEVTDDGENFAAEESCMKNICGAFCYPEYRGKGVAQELLNYVVSKLRR